MADVIWNGATDGVVTTNGNYVGGSAPGPGDSVYATIAPTSPMSSGTFPALVNFVVTEAYGVNPIGSAASPIGFGNVTTMRLAHRGPSYLNSSGTVTTTNFEMPNGATVTLVAGTYTTITATNVTVEAGASAIITNGQSIGAVWNVATNGTAITSWIGTGKITSTSRNITTLTLDGPTALAVTKGTTAITTSNVIAGSMLNHQSSGTLGTTNLRGVSSTLTPRGNPNSAATATTVNRWTGAVLVRAVEGFTLTVTTENAVGPNGVSGGGPA